MTEPDSPPQSDAGYRDRSLGLAVLGVVEILLGLLCLLLVPLTLLAAAATHALAGAGASPDWRTIVPGMLVYAVLGVVLVWLGVGSIRARRWARALLLSMSWLWLITGAFALLASWWLLPAVWTRVAGLGDWPSGIALLVELGTALLLSLIYVALPAAFVLFYRSEAVIATCRARDPGPSLVADSPPQVLSLAMVFALGALSVLLMPAYDFVLPVFGLLATGTAGAAGWGLILLLLLWLTWRSLHRDPRAWWAATAATLVGAASSAVTVAAVPVSVLLERMRLPAEQLAILQAVPWPAPSTLTLLTALSWATLLAYLLYVRRWFAGPGATG